MFDSVFLTIRHAARRLLRNPGPALLAMLLLSLGIASTTAVFGLISGVLLTPPPYEDPDELVFVSAVSAENREQAGLFGWPEQLWDEWLADTESFAAIAGYRWVFNFLVSNEGSEPLEGMLVSDDYFSVVGIEPELGRAFLEWDSEFSDEIVIGHDLWVRRFESDPDIIGRRINMFGGRTVVGVMPPNVRFLPSPGVAAEPNYDLHASVDFWYPIPQEMRGRPAWNAIGRLNPGVTTAEAEAEAALRLARFAETVPDIEGLAAQLDPLTSILNAEAEQLLLPLLAAAALVLLIACGNATALLLIRGIRRQHEFGLRTAIGAGRRHMFALVLAESGILAIASGVIGVVLAIALVRLFMGASGDAIPRLEDVTIGWPVFTFGFVAALVACLAAGLAPAVRAARLDPVDSLRLGGAKSSDGQAQRRLLGTVIVAQTALTLALLVGAGLLIRTMANLDALQPGYDTRNLLTMSVTAIGGDDYIAFHEQAIDRVTSLPGVEAAAFAWGVPLTGNSWPGRIEIQGYSPQNSNDAFVSLPLRSVTGGYFDMLNQPVLLGRDFRSSDRRGEPPVAVVNETFVERYIDGGNAIGKRIWTNGRENPPTQIVGVISDSRTDDLTAAPEPEVYFPLYQRSANSKHLVIRSALPPESLAGSVRIALQDLLPSVAIEAVKTLEEIRGESLASRNFAMQLLIGFAVIASALTLGGVYSVLSLSVAARRHEIAIRSAVGAERGRILQLVLSQGMRMIVIGSVAGIVVSIVLARVLQTWLYGVATIDVITLLGAVALFAVVALIACWVPAYRASTIEPVEALRCE